jgi:hypothetical protein
MADPETPAVATETPASRLSDDPKIVDAVQAHLDAFDDIVTPDTPEVKETPAAEAAPAGATPKAIEESPSEPVDKNVRTSEEVPTEPTKEAAAAPASTLPAAYVRSAKARGWTDEEIQSAVELNPDKALQTFERMHTSRTQEINEWAELGRRVRNQGQTGAPAPASSSAPAPAVTPTAALQPINVKETAEKFGNEELIEALAGPVNAAIKALQPIMQTAAQAEAQAKRAAQEALGKTVQDFFTHTSMAPYSEAYGKGEWGKLTPAQQETRQKVLETADALIAGAAFQGRKLSVQDALTLAHDSVSAPVKETVIRDQLKAAVKKRAAGITLKPTAQGRAAQGGPPSSKAELMTRTEDRLAKAFS